VNGISLAVLPFLNLSSDREQEFFSDGMTEEITSALAKVPNLRSNVSVCKIATPSRLGSTLGQPSPFFPKR